MVYNFRVTLTGIKGFYRVYSLNGSHSLYTFHKQMRADMEFPIDQPILFKALDADGNVVARYALFDLGNGTVDSITVADALKAGITSFVYFYDVQSRKSVNITFEAEAPGICTSPVIIDSKGPNPIEFEHGYVAFEDLPEDKRRLPGHSTKPGDEDLDGEEDDEDEDEEDEDKEEEELLVDEDEQ